MDIADVKKAREEIEKEYRVAGERILNPGKFENAPVYSQRS